MEDSSTDRVHVRRDVVAAIAAHARRESPKECCGLLVGNAREVCDAVETANVAVEPNRHYQVSPVDHFALIKRCRETSVQGSVPLEVIGVYHSHPRSAPVPSPTDRCEAFGDFLYVIVGPVGGPAPMEMRAYRLNDGEFEDVALGAEPPSD